MPRPKFSFATPLATGARGTVHVPAEAARSATSISPFSRQAMTASPEESTAIRTCSK